MRQATYAGQASPAATVAPCPKPTPSTFKLGPRPPPSLSCVPIEFASDYMLAAVPHLE